MSVLRDHIQLCDEGVSSDDEDLFPPVYLGSSSVSSSSSGSSSVASRATGSSNVGLSSELVASRPLSQTTLPAVQVLVLCLCQIEIQSLCQK